MPPPNAMITASTAVDGCGKFSTVGQAEDFFKMRCGFNPVCHGTGSPFGDFTKPDLFKVFLNQNSRVSCIGGTAKLIDGNDWMKSVMLAKAMGMGCPSGSNPGTVMPPPAANQTQDPKAPPLAADEVTCISNYTKAVAGKQ